MIRPFTGWHMAAIIVSFFAVIIAVNFTMAGFAIGTFGGTVVDNSYVASQRYNGWLAAARAQTLLGWTISATLDSRRHIRIAARSAIGPLSDADISAVALHPVGQQPDRGLQFVIVGPGQFMSAEALPAGRYLLQVRVRRGGQVANFKHSVEA